MNGDEEVRVMRNAETVLTIIHERGKQGLPLEDIYRQLYNPHLYMRAYEHLRPNKGALTPGVTGETVDGMSFEKVQKIIEVVRHERYRWTPTKRVYIPKRNGKLRPLGLPTWTDKLLQEVMRQILEAYYEPQFSRNSHGFRPYRGCHTALDTVKHAWIGTRWFIEGDISQCFDRLDHDVLMTTMREKLHDNRFLRLVENMLKAGYMEEWRWNATYSGSPQGGVISPILSNIYLDRLDQYAERELLPQYNRGKGRAKNPEYYRVQNALYRARDRGDHQTMQELTLRRRTIPEGDPDDPDFRRLKYIRYADDFLLGFIGPKVEAEEIKGKLRAFLRDTLKVELTDDKTLITHAKTEAARFLGYEIKNLQSNDHIDRQNRRNVNGKIGLFVPGDVVERKCAERMSGDKPGHRTELINDSDYSIVMQYQAEYRGLAQYYQLAQNVSTLHRYCYVMRVSLLKTLALKHKTSAIAIVRKYHATTETEHGPMKCLQVVVNRGEEKPPLVARFGGIPLRRRKKAILQDVHWRVHPTSTDLLDRMLADKCEVCGAEGDCEVHHIRKLANIRKEGKQEKPEWMRHMIAMRRKTLVVCKACHHAIHAGKPYETQNGKIAGEPGTRKRVRPVRGRGSGKGR
jgi:group II intron reverse transcriptase/maturase